MSDQTELLQRMQESISKIEKEAQALQRVADARAQALMMVMNKLAQFEFDQSINGGDLVEQMGELHEALSSTEGLDMDLTPRVLVDEDGLFWGVGGEWTEDIEEAVAFYGEVKCDPGERAITLKEASEGESQAAPDDRG